MKAKQQIDYMIWYFIGMSLENNSNQSIDFKLRSWIRHQMEKDFIFYNDYLIRMELKKVNQ